MAWDLAKSPSKRRASVLAAALLALVARTSWAQPATEPTVDPCVPCHLTAAEPRLREPAEQLPLSVHAAARLGCVDCHGGDATVDSMAAHAATAGFLGKPTGSTGIERCGGCHADASQIRPFAPKLALDARDALLGSRHGLLVTAGDEAAPSCPDCHGSHDTRRGTDSLAWVNRARVAELCGRCHADPGRMAGHRSPTTQLDRWRRSAHGEALARGEPLAPTCTSCHGAHQDAQPGSPSERARCASCHPAAAVYLERGTHAAPLSARGLDPCLSCHDAHDAPAGSRSLLGLGAGSSCARCHVGADSSGAAIAGLSAAIRASRQGAADARRAARTAIEAGAFVSPAAIGRLEAAELLLRPRIHECELTRLAPLLTELDEASAAVRGAARAVPTTNRLLGSASMLLVIALVGCGVVILTLAFALGISSRRRARLHRSGAA